MRKDILLREQYLRGGSEKQQNTSKQPQAALSCERVKHGGESVMERLLP